MRLIPRTNIDIVNLNKGDILIDVVETIRTKKWTCLEIDDIDKSVLDVKKFDPKNPKAEWYDYSKPFITLSDGPKLSVSSFEVPAKAWDPELSRYISIDVGPNSDGEEPNTDFLYAQALNDYLWTCYRLMKAVKPEDCYAVLGVGPMEYLRRNMWSFGVIEQFEDIEDHSGFGISSWIDGHLLEISTAYNEADFYEGMKVDLSSYFTSTMKYGDMEDFDFYGNPEVLPYISVFIYEVKRFFNEFLPVVPNNKTGLTIVYRKVGEL
jgi:hypothetical protein